MQNKSIIGIDLGGTNVRCGIVNDDHLTNILSKRINAQGSAKDVLAELFSITDQLFTSSVQAIGIGVPGLVDEEKQLVYDVVYIPAWKEVPLQKWMEDRYHVPVVINNDANCFALGEFYFGKGKGQQSMIGLTIGTGLGSGIIINNKLYAGANGGAGEIGMVDYLDKTYEYYASGQFFQNVYQTDGEVIFDLARQGDQQALKKYEEMGFHLGNAIKTILYSFDPRLIVLGGSVRHAWPYFNKSMWQSIQTIGFQRGLKHLRIEVSELENSGLLGAAALYYDSMKKPA